MQNQKNEAGNLLPQTALPNYAEPEINTIQELTQGCNKAIVTYGLKERFGRPNQFKTFKMVILFNTNELDFETVKVGADNLMFKHSVSLCKTTMFTIIGNTIKQSYNMFKACLFRNIFGFTVNNEVVDYSERYNNTINGRAEL